MSVVSLDQQSEDTEDQGTPLGGWDADTGAPLPGLSENVSHGTEGADGGGHGETAGDRGATADAGGPTAIDILKADAAAQGMSMYRYMREYGMLDRQAIGDIRSNEITVGLRPLE